VPTAAGDIGSPLAVCEVGDQVMSGGFYIQNGPLDGSVRLMASYPQMPENGWQMISAFNASPQSVEIVATVVCQDLTPGP
jgi:hypothetical protein